jgi:hypothetical protein
MKRFSTGGLLPPLLSGKRSNNSEFLPPKTPKTTRIKQRRNFFDDRDVEILENRVFRRSIQNPLPPQPPLPDNHELKNACQALKIMFFGENIELRKHAFASLEGGEETALNALRLLKDHWLRRYGGDGDVGNAFTRQVSEIRYFASFRYSKVEDFFNMLLKESLRLERQSEEPVNLKVL